MPDKEEDIDGKECSCDPKPEEDRDREGRPE